MILVLHTFTFYSMSMPTEISLYLNANTPGPAGAGGVASSIFAWVVGGPANFDDPPVAGDTTFQNDLLAGYNVIFFRNGFFQLPLNPLNTNSYFTKVKASDTMNFPALGAGDELCVITIPS